MEEQNNLLIIRKPTQEDKLEKISELFLCILKELGLNVWLFLTNVTFLSFLVQLLVLLILLVVEGSDDK